MFIFVTEEDRVARMVSEFENLDEKINWMDF